MTARVTGRLAWSLWTVTMAVAATALVLLVVAVEFDRPDEAWGFPGFAATLSVLFGTVGALVISRRPGNAIGWIFVAVALCSAVQEFVIVYGAIAYRDPMRSLPGATHAAWIADWIPYIATGSLLVFLFLLFPHGRLPDRRWLPVAVLGGVGMILGFVGSAFTPGPLLTFPVVENPLGLLASRDVASRFVVAGTSLLGVAGVLAVTSVAVRWRRAVSSERQQYKWLVAAGAVCLVSLGLQPVVPVLFVAELGAIVGFGIIPVAVGIAILRYQLYDIDQLVSRTVSYAVMVGVLAAVYAGSVFILTSLLPLPLEGDLAVAGSTLVVAALFNPVRRRVQQQVDRRFNRTRYDAANEIERFAGRLRTDLDVDELTGDLLGVVATTVQPSAASVWIRRQRVELADHA